MDENRCAKCGEELKAEALTCWACGTLTAAGRRAKGLPDNEEELWRHSVEAAKARAAEKPVVDPDEALRKVIAQSGTEEQLQRVNRAGLAHDDLRSDYAALRASAGTTKTMGLLLAVLFALSGLLLVVRAILTQTGSAVAAEVLAVLVLSVTAAVSVHLGFRYLADLTLAVADAADNARRSVLLLREQAAARAKDETPS